MRKEVLLLAVTVLPLISCDDEPTAVPTATTYTATLSGANERPNPITTNGTGAFTATLNPATNVLSYTLTYSGLGTTADKAHIHGPILETSGNAALSVLIDLNAPNAGRTIVFGTSGSAQGTIDLNSALNATISGDSLRKLFDGGKLYVNVHTTINTGGEILGLISSSSALGGARVITRTPRL